MHLLQVFVIATMLLVAINAGGSYTEKNPDTCQFPDLNMCNYIQCSNNGTCQKSNNSDCFTCTCPPGFSGKMCFDIVPETEPDCSSSPCLNGATCLMTALKTFFCLCPNEFYGLRCEARIERPNTTDVCSPNPCSNNGQCIDLGGRTACICPQYATGQYCEQNTTQDSLCEAFQPFCQNGGSCVAGNDTVYCACPPGYTDPFCNTKINLSNPCSSSPCLNGGICYNYRGQAMCLCSTQTSGRYCEYGSYDPCDSAPCMNNGTCISQNQTFACRCPQGTTGDQCETRIQLTCEDKPCHNGGTCYQNADSFICMCRSQYEGEQCDVMNIAAQCPLDCFPGDCIRTDVPQYPYACSCQGTIRLDSCEGI